MLVGNAAFLRQIRHKLAFATLSCHQILKSIQTLVKNQKCIETAMYYVFG